MRRFLLKTSFLSIPIILCFLFTKLFYVTDKGDLLRLGYIINLYPAYRDVFQEEFKNKIVFDRISDKPENSNYTILTIGDSFSEQGRIGYQNYLSLNNGINVIHFDKNLNQNTIETAYKLLNGDFFEHYKVKYVIIQSVERYFIQFFDKVDTTKILTLSALDTLIIKSKNIKKSKIIYPTDRIVKFPYYTINYFLRNDFYFPQVHRVKLNDYPFSVNTNELLFYHQDLELLKFNNNEFRVIKANNQLNHLSNRLKDKNIKLIVLPCPDKYDIYYESILLKENYPRPLFFDHMKRLNKNYIYIDSKKIVNKYLKSKKDLYFYDDTHWSPWTSMIIADEIKKIIE